MTNATAPTSLNLSIAGGLVKFPVDNPSSIIPLICSIAAVPTTATFTEVTSLLTNAAYGAVPASTNLQVYGLETANFTQNSSTSYSILQIGYDNDGAGTGFTLLYDLGKYLQLGYGNNSNIVIGNITVPTTKHLVVKTTTSGTANSTLLLKFFGLQTN